MSQYTHYPISGGAGGVPIYPTFALFPAGQTVGQLAVAADTGVLYEWNGSAWVPIGSPGAALSIGSPANGLDITANVLTIAQASGSLTGALKSADWTTFNNKQNALSFGNLTDAGADGIVVTGGTGAVIGSGASLAQHVADSTHNGYLSSADWTTFNAKQAAGNYITALTGDGTATGPGSVAFTLATVNSNVGTFAVQTVNAKGLVTAATTITGDATTSGAALTLATVNSNVGSFGSSTAIPSFTVNAKGLVTAASTNVVIAPAGTLTGTTLASNVVSSSLTSVGTIATGVWNGTTIAIANGGTGQTSANPAFNALSPLTTKGDILGFSTVNARLPVGTDGFGIFADSTQTLGIKWAAALSNPMTSVGDIIVGTTAGAPARLAIGTAGQQLTVVSGTPAWVGPNLPPQIQRFNSGSGTYALTYAFIIASGSATSGATYTNNSVTFTVSRTIASATLVYMTGSGAPTSSGTLTKSGGTGDATLTFSSFRSPLYLKVYATAGGGGGANAGTAAGTVATAGSNTTFGSSLLTANGGSQGTWQGAGPTGGAYTVSSPAIDAGSVEGADGSGAQSGPTTANATGVSGGAGGNSYWGGGGAAGPAGGGGGSGKTNTGAGGGGGGINNTNASSSGAGGAAGGTCIAIIESPSVTYAYSIGAGGNGGTSPVNGRTGGNGAAGKIVVEEHFQ